MVYDAARQQIVLFGGEASANNPLNDTWVWDGVTWTRKTPLKHLPLARGAITRWRTTNLHQQVGDLWQARAPAGSSAIPGYGTVPIGAQKSPAASPPTRQYPVMVYDAARQNTVMFGGLNNVTGAFSDTWLWNGTTWTQAAPAASPSARVYPQMAYDAARQTVVLFAAETPAIRFRPDTWEWDGSNWNQLFCHRRVRPGAPKLKMVFDAAHQQLVMFAGASNTRITA